MSELNDVVAALKGRVDELEARAKQQKAAFDAVERENLTVRTNLALAQIENQELRAKLDATPADVYDPLPELLDIGVRIDAMLGKPVVIVDDPHSAEPSPVISHDLVAPVVNPDVVAATDAAIADLNQVATES